MREAWYDKKKPAAFFAPEQQGGVLMEIQRAGRLQRNEQRVRTEEGKPGRAEPKSRARKHREDRIAISKQILAALEEQNRQAREEQERRKLESQKKEGGSGPDAITKALKKMAKCQKIAARIQAGDKVPPQDEKYLMENDPRGYQLAVAMRKPKHNPKKWDTVLEDEDREGGSCESSESAGDGEAPESSGEISEA